MDKEEWINVNSFQTKKEAIAFAIKEYGADSKGRVSLVTKA